MILAAALAIAAPAASATPPCAAICDAAALRPVFAAVRNARAQRRLVRIVQIGDSHTAGDQVTGSWRSLLQARFGAGGRGILPPARPYQGYLTRGVTVSASPGWVISGIFGPAWRGAAGGAIGVSGYAATAGEGATMALAADSPDHVFDRVVVCGEPKAGAGNVVIEAGGATAILALGAADPAAVKCATLDLPATASRVTVGVVGGSVTLTSWATERRGGGVTLSNLGTVGAQLVHFTARTDDAVVAGELATYRPDLIVVAFGTNDAFVPAFSAGAYRTRLRAGLERVRRLAPGVPILLLGAPDSTTRLATLQSGEAGAASACPPLADGAPAPTNTAALAVVQAIQRETAHAMGVAFWDWAQAMGGRCSANALAAATPARMRGDHVHFTTIGAAEIARMLEADWEAAMAADAATPLPANP